MEQHPPDEQERIFAQFVAWSDALARSGHHAGVERLERDGRTVSARGGQLVVDGPYAEGKETVMGFFVIEAETIEEAARIAGGIPSVGLGAKVEVRPLAPFPKPGASVMDGIAPRG